MNAFDMKRYSDEHNRTNVKWMIRRLQDSIKQKARYGHYETSRAIECTREQAIQIKQHFDAQRYITTYAGHPNGRYTIFTISWNQDLYIDRII